MMHNDLQETERGTFRAAADLGIWDILIAAFLSMFAFAPLLSGRLGEVRGGELFHAAQALSIEQGGSQAAVFLVLLSIVCVVVLLRRIAAPTRV